MFPQLRDGTGIVQCVVVKSSVAPEVWDALKPLGQESSLIVHGRVREDTRAPGGVEIDVIDAEVVQNAHDYPITPKEHGPEFLLDHRHLWLRSRKQHAILKVRAHRQSAPCRIISTTRIHAVRHADLHAGSMRRNHHSF